MKTPQPAGERNPLEESALHRALVFTNQLQELPNNVVIASFFIDAAAVALVWLGRGIEVALSLAALTLVGAFAGWAIFSELPRAQLSFGPDKPPALALAALVALIGALCGALGLPVWLAGAAMTLPILLAFYATHIEPFMLRVTEQTLAIPGWSGALRVLHIGDIHVERVTAREQRMNALIERMQPDVIVFSGDFVNLSYTFDDDARAAIRQIVGAWRAPLGVFAVPGTSIVEPLPRVLSFVDGLNVSLLANRWQTVETPGGALHILGLITTHDLKTDRAALADMMQRAPTAPGVRLLLTHAPDVAPEAAAAGIDWYVCGHTHGGQIRLPIIGALFSSSHLGQRFIMGRYQVGRMTLYTTRGVGMEGLGAPRARLLCPPEIVLWTLQGT
jgi:hypothetical protein